MPVSSWPSSTIYEHDIKIIKQLSVVNDCAERALGLATSLHGPTRPKQESQLQATYKIVDAIRKFQGSITNSTEHVSKKNLEPFFKSSLVQDE